MTKQNTPATIHPGQWEVIDGMARPKNTFDPIEQAYDWDGRQNHIDEFETYPAPSLKDAVYKAEQLQFVWQIRTNKDLVEAGIDREIIWRDMCENSVKYMIKEPNEEPQFRLAITATPTEVKEPEESVITSKQHDSLPKEHRDLYEPHLGEYYYSSSGSEKATNRPWSEAKKYTGFCATVTHYKLIEVVTPTTLLSEGKETVEIHDLVNKILKYLHSNISASIVYEDFHDFSKGIKGVEVDYFYETADELFADMGLTDSLQQSQHTAKEIEALQARVAELEVKIKGKSLVQYVMAVTKKADNKQYIKCFNTKTQMGKWVKTNGIEYLIGDIKKFEFA